MSWHVTLQILSFILSAFKNKVWTNIYSKWRQTRPSQENIEKKSYHCRWYSLKLKIWRKYLENDEYAVEVEELPQVSASPEHMDSVHHDEVFNQIKYSLISHSKLPSYFSCFQLAYSATTDSGSSSQVSTYNSIGSCCSYRPAARRVNK